MAKKANVGKQAPNKVGKQAHNNVGKQAPNNVGKQAPNNVGKQAPNNVGKQAPNNVGKQARKQKIRRTSSCMLCCSTFDTANSHNHMCSLGHQRQLAKIKSDYVPECQACGTKYVKMKNFVLHISTIEHKAKVKKLLKSNKKPICLEKCLDTETLKKIKNRNKLQRRLEKKAKNKKKKEELKKVCAGGGVSKTPKQQKQQNMVKQEKTPKQPKGAASKQPQQNLQNKENKLAGRLGWQNRGQQAAPQQQTEAPPSQSERRLYNAQIVQSASSQSEGWGVPMTAPEQSTWSNSRQMGYSSSYNSSGTDHDFASVRLPHTRPTGEYKCTTRDSGAGLPSNPASISRLKGSTPPPTQDEGTGPIGSADVHKMLSNVRKALQTEKRAQAQSPSGGSEARRSWDQSSQVKVGEAGKHTELDTLAHGSIRSASLSTTGFPSIQSQQVSTSNAMPAKGARPNQKADITAQGRTPQTAKDGIETQFSMVSDSDGPESQDGPAAALRHGAPRALPASLSRHMSRTGPQAEPNLNTARRVRSLGGGGAREGEKEPEVKAIVQKLLGSGGSQRKVNWKEMYQEANRKKQEKVKGMPRFGIELVSPVSDPDGFTFYEDEEIPLTEGFHWESTQLVQLDPTQLVQLDHPAPPPPPAPHPQATPAPEIPQEAPLQGAEQPSVAPRAKRTAKPSAPVSVKAEPGWDGTGEGGLDRRAGDGQGDGQGEGRGKRKRKPQDTEYPGVSGLNPSGKKQKGKSKNDKVQVDQLLAVSLKEEELCRSMQTVDGSLIQARNALQAAYAEVQRLLLVKQQVIDEINSLRARRIEILQGMQGGQNPLPHALSSPYTSSVLPPSVPSPPIPSLSPLTPVHPSSHFMANPSPLHPASSILQAIKQEALSSHSLPAATLPSQQRALSSAAAPVLTPPVSGSKPPEGQSMVKLEARSKMSDSSSSTASDSEEEQEGSAPGDRRGGPVDDDSDCVVVSIEDSDTEDVPEGHASSHHHPGPSHHHPGPSQQSSAPPPPPPPPDSLEAAFVEVSSSATQTAVPLTHIKGVKIKEDPHIKGMKIKEDPHDRGARPDQEPEDVEPSLGSFLGHTGPVHGLQIHGGLLYTCSGDNTARAYSLVTRECHAVFVGHTSKINCLLVSPPRLPARLYTGSSDETVRCFSIKSQKCLELLSLPDRVLCLHSAWNILYVGLANGSVVSFDIKTLRQLDVFECHGPRGISCLGSCQEGARRLLLVGSYDSTISVRDARSSLLLRTLQGHSKTVLCSKVVNDLVFSGSSDTSVHAHNVHTGELVDIYKGHTHAVTAVAVLGKVMVTACLDKLVRVYELQSHDRLQVYGGHSDMVMCLAIHKSVIYTGCYDGTVQAVKLNLMENYRCWWHGCTLIFGVKDHLLQHLLSDHSHPHQPTLKCRWRDCSAFYTTKNLQKELPGHMQTHVEMDSKLDT